MQPNIDSKVTVKRIAEKEVSLFFASPVAYLFLATFAAVTLFVFFWGESFFARNIADVRPLFDWMPLLLIFLCATLTMRLWSEERRNGTLEFVLTQSVPLWHFVVGKFLGCLFLFGSCSGDHPPCSYHCLSDGGAGLGACVVRLYCHSLYGGGLFKYWTVCLCPK